MRRDVDGESRKNTPSARPAHGRAQSPAQAAQRRAGPPGRAQFTGPGGGAGGSRVGAVHAGVPADTGLRQQHVPAVKDGDLLIGYRLQGTYAKNDVVLYEQDGKLRVGRVLGRENDLIALDDSGTLIVNGSAQSGEILYPTYAKDTLEYPYTVPADSVFILGDYRTQSEDSRDFGPVALTDVKAKVITLLRRRSL